MSNYPAEFKDAMISKMTAPGGRSATSLGKEIGIAQSTLSRWLRKSFVPIEVAMDPESTLTFSPALPSLRYTAG